MPIYNRALEHIQHNWIDWLECSANLYKHSAVNQIMTFYQSPDCKYVADELTWGKAGRYLNFNARYISSISISSNNVTEHKLYDISSTYGADVAINNPYILTESDKQALSQVYRNDDLKSALKVITATIIKGNNDTKNSIIKNSTY